MPRSSKAPEPPPEPDINELIQNDVAKIKRLLGLDVNRLAIGQEIEGIVEGGVFGSNDYTITGVNTIEFVNVVSDIVYGIQTNAIDTVAPSQVTGLVATPLNNTIINLNWDANTEIDLNLYNVYRGTSSGFTIILGTTTPTATPSTNSYSDTGRTASTAYYYKVAAVDTSTNIGALSTQANATTYLTSSANLLLPFDGNYNDASSFGNTVNSSNTSGFAGSGVFGSNSVVLNVAAGKLDYVAVPNSTNTALDLVNGFSYSCWIYPTSTDTSQYILSKWIDSSNYIGIEYQGATSFISVDVWEGGVRRGVKTPTGISLNTWHHVVLTDSGTTTKIYLDKVLSTTSNTAAFAASVTTDLIIGGLAGNTDVSGSTSPLSQVFRGRIDEFQYFKGVVLTQTQVNNLFATNAP